MCGLVAKAPDTQAVYGTDYRTRVRASSGPLINFNYKMSVIILFRSDII